MPAVASPPAKRSHAAAVAVVDLESMTRKCYLSTASRPRSGSRGGGDLHIAPRVVGPPPPMMRRFPVAGKWTLATWPGVNADSPGHSTGSGTVVRTAPANVPLVGLGSPARSVATVPSVLRSASTWPGPHWHRSASTWPSPHRHRSAESIIQAAGARQIVIAATTPAAPRTGTDPRGHGRA